MAFLTSLPNINDSASQPALINHAALDVELACQIRFGSSAAQFVELLVPQLVRYGQLDDGRHALVAILESAKDYVGQDRKSHCERLIQELHAFLNK